MLISIHSNGSGCTDEHIVHPLPQHVASSFRKEFEAIVEEVIDEVLLEYFEAAFLDSDDVNNS